MSRCLPLVPQERTLVWHAPKHYADRMLWNIDRSNICFYEIAISIRAKSAKGGSADCFDPNRSRAPTAIASLHQFAARRRTPSAPKKGASCRATRTRSRRGRSSEYAVNLGGHDEVVLMQSLDLLGLQRDRRIAPTEADIRMMAFGFREFTNLLNKGKRLAEIAKPEAPLDAVSFLRQLPVWGLGVKELSLLAREWGHSPATGSTGFASKSFGHVACPSCQPSPA